MVATGGVACAGTGVELPPQRPTPQTISVDSSQCFWQDDSAAPSSPEQVAGDIGRLSDVTDMPYICDDLCLGGNGCGDAAFWRVVRHGEAAIPGLLKLLSDPTPTTARVHNFGFDYAVGDVAYAAIQEIVHDTPKLDTLVGVPMSEECGLCSWWEFLRADVANRKRMGEALTTWFAERKLAWEDDGQERGSLVGVDCVSNCQHPAGGHFRSHPRKPTTDLTQSKPTRAAFPRA